MVQADYALTSMTYVRNVSVNGTQGNTAASRLHWRKPASSSRVKYRRREMLGETTVVCGTVCSSVTSQVKSSSL